MLLLLFLYEYPIYHEAHDFSSLPSMELGPVGSFNDTTFAIAFTPVTNVTQQIMDKVALASFMKGEFSGNQREIFLMTIFGSSDFRCMHLICISVDKPRYLSDFLDYVKLECTVSHERTLELA